MVWGLIVAILNLGAPLDYHLIFGAGLYTAVYIISRAIGKYFGAYFGASITHAPESVKKYLGFTLLPHSGVSLVFTGIAVSVLSGTAQDCAAILQGTIAAAAVINEIIAVFMAKKGFEWGRRTARVTKRRTTTLTQEERKAHSKELILSASMHEFGAHGYASVTVDSICAKHGISKGMLYHYYSGKDDLFLLCANQVFHELVLQLKREL